MLSPAPTRVEEPPCLPVTQIERRWPFHSNQDVQAVTSFCHYRVMNLVHDRLDNRTLRLAGAGCAILLLSCALKAEETCNVEAKLLLDPAQTQTAIQALRAKRETPSHVYFYDTAALDLLTQGVILRLRQGAETEFTVKMRHPQGKSFADPSEGPGRISFKCEVDFIGGQGKPSYSLKSGYPEGQIPPTGRSFGRPSVRRKPDC